MAPLGYVPDNLYDKTGTYRGTIVSKKGLKELEYVICSAIWFNDGKEHVHQPKNIKTGFIISGRRHHNCYATFHVIGLSLGLEGIAKNQIDRVDRDYQGFLTNLNRYVDRSEAYQIALKAGQLLHDMHDKSNPILTSEDIFP